MKRVLVVGLAFALMLVAKVYMAAPQAVEAFTLK
jgi:hypothetical protein